MHLISRNQEKHRQQGNTNDDDLIIKFEGCVELMQLNQFQQKSHSQEKTHEYNNPLLSLGILR